MGDLERAESRPLADSSLDPFMVNFLYGIRGGAMKYRGSLRRRFVQAFVVALAQKAAVLLYWLVIIGLLHIIFRVVPRYIAALG